MRAHGVILGFLATLSFVAGHPVVENDKDFGQDFGLYSDVDMFVYDDDNNLVPLEVFGDRDEDDESDDKTNEDLNSRVFFYLYTRKNPSNPQQLFIGDQKTLEKSDFDPQKPTRVITHGWMNSRKSAACTSIRDAYIQHDDYNVIVIDWSRISYRPYIWASRRVKVVGNHVATFIDFLEENGLNLNDTTLVGHSLGAHVMGLAAYNAKGVVNYVVGLDPALPGFTFAGPGSRISIGDAAHVEVIHTNAGLLGYLSAIGNSDFYPNGGSWQLGCLIDVGGACSHARSFQFFAESINSSVGFHGKSCRNYLQYKLGRCRNKQSAIMGEHKKVFNATGPYFLQTNSQFPFARGGAI